MPKEIFELAIKDIVEIGSVLYNTSTKEIVGFLDQG